MMMNKLCYYVVATRYIKNNLYVTYLPVCRPQAHAHKSNNIHLKTNRNNEHESMNKNKHKMAHECGTLFFYIYPILKVQYVHIYMYLHLVGRRQ